ncbi:MAG: hypothetical protein J2P15_02075 [Micromonosporaceae bacterium]|nr:hypothetical protein [Micromonosporaceae bacterium]
MVLWHDEAAQPREQFSGRPRLSSGSTGIPAAGFGRARDAWERLAFRCGLVGLSVALLAVLALVLHMRLSG